MYMLFIGNVFLVEVVDVDGFCAVGGTKLAEEIFLELLGVIVDDFVRVLPDDEHLTDVTFACYMAFETCLMLRLSIVR